VLSARAEDEARSNLAYVDGRAQLDEASMDAMTWDIGDTGFLMGLSSRVPDVLAKHLPAYLRRLLGPHALDEDDIDFWAIHPGGRAIVERAQEVIGLTDADVHDSLDVLRQHGNMSSPTILFVLKRFLDRHQATQTNGQRSREHGVAMAFGPGLTIEGCLLRRV